MVVLVCAAPARPEEFAILSYNTHRLSAWIAGDDPATRFPLIARKTAGYDLVLLQEDFAHHAALRRHARHPIVARGNPSRFGAWCPFCGGSGLTFLADLDGATLVTVVNRAYDDCSGWFARANDCLATKGFQRARLRLGNGGRLDVVNTHLDAGRAEADRAARRRQLALLEAHLEEAVGKGALIVAGDLNLNAAVAEEAGERDAFVGRLGLTDSGARASNDGGWSVLDYIYYRSGGGVTLEVVAAGEDESFTHEDRPLSDHPAIFARFRARHRDPQ